ncbi:CYTH domain-containing protein [Halomonas sp. BLK-85]
MQLKNQGAPSPQEIELKLALPDTSIPRVKRLPLLACQAPSQHTLVNTYYDTPEGLLAEQRVALRLRHDDGQIVQTVKTAGMGGGGLSTRGEWEWPLEAATLDIEGLKGLPPFAAIGPERLAELAPQLETNFLRTRWEIEHSGNRVEVALDEGEIVSGQHTTPIRELELELKSGHPDALWELATLIAKATPLRPSDSSKAARGRCLAEQHWPLPDARSPSALLHRATLALDAWHDSQREAHLAAAEDSLRQLSAHPALDKTLREFARQLTCGLDSHGQPDRYFGPAALALARRLNEPGALS